MFRFVGDALAPIAVLVLVALLTSAAVAGDKGALTNFGGKWGWEGTGEAFVPQLVMYGTPDTFFDEPAKVDRDIETFMREHGFTGFHVPVACRWFDIGESRCADIGGSEPEIDQRTFDALKMLITKTHDAGGMVHLWMWGDEERTQTASSRPGWGGQMGRVEKKLLDEIARQLGPLEGWTMGYGFDLDEWTTADELEQWRDYLQARLPSFHFLGGRPEGPNHGTNHLTLTTWNEDMDYASFEHHRPSYEVYVAALEAADGKPVMSEDRFRVRQGGYPDKDYTEAMTRRGMWISTMAGGVGNIWGRLNGGDSDKGSKPYANREQLQTYARFFENRFTKDMTRCSDVASSDTLCLRRADDAAYVFYEQDTDAVTLDVSRLAGPQPAIAVDARKAYAEIPLGTIAPGEWTWGAPYESDWAIAVGQFAARKSASETEDSERTDGTASCLRRGNQAANGARQGGPRFKTGASRWSSRSRHCTGASRRRRSGWGGSGREARWARTRHCS